MEHDGAAPRRGGAAPRHGGAASQYDDAALLHDDTASQHDIAALQDDITAPQDDITALQDDITALQYDCTAYQYDATTLQHDDATLQHDDATLQHDDAALEHDDAALEHDDAALEHDDATLENDDAALEHDDAASQHDDVASQHEATSFQQDVVELIYWRDVKRTGAVFAGLLVLLISMAFLSLISVVSYASLTILTGTITYRVYKNIMQAVQKSQDGHPFKTFLELDTDLPADKVHEASEVVMNQINLTITELKRLFFVEDLVDSIKFGCLLWCLTYLGSWFNGLTLVILATVAVFTLPKVYEQNKAHIDQYWTLVRTQVNDVMTKVKAAIPIGNKEKTQ